MKGGGDVRLLLLLMAVAVVAALIYFQQRVAEVRHDAQVSELISRLRSLEVAMDRDLVRLSALRLGDYDSLVGTRKALLATLARLDRLGVESRQEGAQVATALAAYRERLLARLDRMERAKYEAAVIRNSLAYLPELTRQLAEEQPALQTDFLRLLSRLYRRQLFPDQVRRQTIESLLAGIPKESAYRVAPIRRHLELVLEHGERLARQLHGLEGEAAPVAYQKLRAVFTRQREVEGNHSLMVGLALVVALMLLLVWLWRTLSHLDSARRQAERSRARLEDAVESLGEAFALFDDGDKLVLTNHAFHEYYPWLGRLARPGVHRAVLERLLAPHLKRTTLQGTPLAGLPEERQGNWIEQLDDGRWYLAGNQRTTEGGALWVRTDITATRDAAHELRKLGRAMEQSPVSIVITDVHGIIEYVNPKCEEVSGYKASELLGQRPSIFKGGDLDSADYAEMWQTLLSGREWKGEFHNRRKDGTMFWESAVISPVRDDSGLITHFIGIKEDITRIKEYQESLRLSATVFEATNEGIILTDAAGRVRTVNPAFTRITGYEAAEVLGRPATLFDPARHSEWMKGIHQALRREGRWSGELVDRCKDGTWFHQWMSVTALHDAEGRISGHVIIFSDITQHKADQARILYHANYDLLTGLPNRTLLMDRIRQAIYQARRTGRQFAMLFIDLDRFKAVNDLYGHGVGDDLLKEVAQRLQRTLRKVDTVARFGGDEFVVLLQEMEGERHAARVAHKIIQRLSRPIRLAGRSLTVGASLGVTLYPRDVVEDEDLEVVCSGLLSNADMAMYQAKARGLNRVHFFEPRMQEEIKRNLELEQDLRQALEREELELYYQPIVDGRDGRLVAVEALMRWQHPRWGRVSPERFIPLAEDTGLIGPLGEWALRTACCEVAAWGQNGGPTPRLAINLSARQREQGFDAPRLGAVLEATGFSVRRLTLEITETLLLEESREVLRWLHGLKETGVRLSVDDFGTGYSSLSYLKRFPVDSLKVDRSFVRDLPKDEGDASLIKAMLAMARSLELDVVAEGVETEAQRRFLVAEGCRLMQGYLFGRPMPARQIPGWDRARR